MYLVRSLYGIVSRSQHSKSPLPNMADASAVVSERLLWLPGNAIDLLQTHRPQPAKDRGSEVSGACLHLVGYFSYCSSSDQPGRPGQLQWSGRPFDCAHCFDSYDGRATAKPIPGAGGGECWVGASSPAVRPFGAELSGSRAARASTGATEPRSERLRWSWSLLQSLGNIAAQHRDVPQSATEATEGPYL